MSMEHTTLLDRFLALSSQVHPALAGELSLQDDHCIRMGQDNRATLEGIYNDLRADQPEAGMPYWSIRCWTLLVWQPVFLAVVGVHGAGILPSLGELRLKAGQGVVAGFRLPRSAWQVGTEDELIERAGASLRALCDAFLAELREITLIKPLSAMRLVADMLLGAISRLHEIRPDLTRSDQLALAQRWLVAAGLEGQSALMPLRLNDGRETLTLDRKGCCMHYRRDDGSLCASCPKQKDAVRLARLKEELSLDA